MAGSLSRVGHLMALQNVATVQPVWIQEVINSYATDPKAQTLEHLQEFPISGCHSFFFGKNRKNLLQQFSIPGCHLYQVRKKSLRARIYARSFPRRIRPYQKRWKGIKIILLLSQSF